MWIWVYFIILMLIPMYFSYRVVRVYNRYSKVRSTSGLTGAEVADKLLKSEGIYDVEVVEGKGFLIDNYDPVRKVITLSSNNYNNASVSGTAVSAHEVGHAIQDKEGYRFFRYRRSLFPLASLGDTLGFWLILMGVLIETGTNLGYGVTLVNTGIAFLSFAVLFQLVTLPVEFDASKRAMTLIKGGIIEGNEERHAKKVLNSAALTYVASAVIAVMELVRLINISE